MKSYLRKDPLFSLCGLNCALCPRFHTEGSSKCPGCGGSDFSIKHPTCAVVTCSKKQGKVQDQNQGQNQGQNQIEYCFECSQFPCERYKTPKQADSFITYQKVLQNLAEAQQDLPRYLEGLREKKKILESLITSCNDGKSKGFYCLAVNLLPLSFLKEAMSTLENAEAFQQMGCKEKAKRVSELFKEKAEAMGLELKLRKSR